MLCLVANFEHKVCSDAADCSPVFGHCLSFTIYVFGSKHAEKEDTRYETESDQKSEEHV